MNVFCFYELLIINGITVLAQPSLIIIEMNNEVAANSATKETHKTHYRDVLQLSIGFFFIFFAFNSSQVN